MMDLTTFERGWARSALSTMFPSGVHARVPGADVIDIGTALQDVLHNVPARVALGLRAAVWLLALAPMFVLFRFRTLPSLDAETRERVVLALLSSRSYAIRQLALLLKAFGALMFVAAPGVRESIVGREPLMQLGRKPEEARHVA